MWFLPSVGNRVRVMGYAELYNMSKECNCGCGGLITPEGNLIYPSMFDFCGEVLEVSTVIGAAVYLFGDNTNSYPIEILNFVYGCYDSAVCSGECANCGTSLPSGFGVESKTSAPPPPIWEQPKEKETFINTTPGMYKTYNGPKMGWVRNKKEE